jgi:hypothetical protein
MAANNRIIYVLENGKKSWINSENDSVKFASVEVSNDPTSNNEVVRKSYADSTYILASQKGANSGVATLNSSGKIPNSQIPAIAITDTFVVASEVAMLALSTAETGDVAVRTDLNKCFILQGTDPATLGDWVELLTPTDVVQSVNGQTGAVTLDSDDVAEGSSNLYFTTTRARDAAVVNALNGTEIDQAPSVNAVNLGLSGKADFNHTHAMSEVTNLETTLATKLDKQDGTIEALNDNASAITLGKLVYVKWNGNVDLAKADALATCGDVVGFVNEASIGANGIGLILVAAGRKVTGLSGLTIGKRYYASATTAGAITDTPDISTVGNVVKAVLLATSATTGIFLPGESEEIIA